MIKKLLFSLIGALACVTMMYAAPEKALSFDGESQYVQMPISDDFHMTSTQDLSIAIWVKPASWSDSAPRVFCCRNGNDSKNGYEMYVRTNGYSATATGIENAGGSGRPIDTVLGLASSLGKWTHVVLVFDRAAGQGYAYMNGTRVTGKTLNSSMVFNSDLNLILGGGWFDNEIDPTRHFEGQLANFRVYRGALTADQAATDMNTNDYAALPEEMKAMCTAAYLLDDDFTALTVEDLAGDNDAQLKNYTLPAEDGYISGVTVEQIADFTGRKNQYEAILRARVFVEGSTTLNAVNLTLNGTTAVSDYAKVDLYTSTINTFDEREASNATRIGSFTPKEGTMNCELDVPVTLSGSQYLWVVAQVADEAVEGNQLDATLEELVTPNETFSIVGGNPSGSREILLARKLLYAPGDNGSVGYRIPAMEILPNGNLVTAIDRRWNSEGDLANKIDIIARISEDGGYTWSEEYPIAIAPDAQNGRGDCALVVCEDGSIVAGFVGGNGYFASSSYDPISSFISRSTDGGKTWTEIAEGGAGDITQQIWGSSVTDDNIRRNGTGAFFGSGRGLRLSHQTGANAHKNGRIMFVTALRNSSSTIYSYVVYSDDNGLTWKVSNSAFTGADEAKVTELSDGTILMSIRRTGARGYNTSTDGGETWGTQGVWNDLSANACNGDILNYTLTSDGYDTNRLIHSLPINDGTNARKQVSIYLSYDEGKTWTRKKTLFPGNSAYSTMVKFEDGTIGVYAEDQRNGTSNYFMRFSLSWLTDGEDEYLAPNTNRVAAPVITPADGTEFVDEESAEISISCETENATIYYTLNGETPSKENGTLYEAPFTITESCTVKTIAYADGVEPSQVVSASYIFRERAYCTYPGNSTHSRKLNSITLVGGKEASFVMSGIDTSNAHPVYQDLTDNVFEAYAGATITPTINWSGEWMHGYMYIDYNNDYEFSYDINDDYTPAAGSEIVSFSFYSETDSQYGYNSAGESCQHNNAFNSPMPSFSLPENLPLGDYRIRFKIDWCSLDPCGGIQSLATNGGNMIDFTLRVVEENAIGELDSENVNVYATEGQIVVAGNQSAVVEIYLTNGVAYKAPFQVSGEQAIDVPAGMYIVKVDGVAKLLNVR